MANALLHVPYPPHMLSWPTEVDPLNELDSERLALPEGGASVENEVPTTRRAGEEVLPAAWTGTANPRAGTSTRRLMMRFMAGTYLHEKGSREGGGEAPPPSF